MEIRCPSCQTLFEPSTEEQAWACPACHAVLEASEHGPGFALVSVVEPGRQGQEQAFPDDDPVLEDHVKWRTGAVFAMVMGVAGLFLMATMVWMDYGETRTIIPVRTADAAVFFVAAAFFVICLAGGATLFLIVHREITRYLAARQHESRTTSPGEAT